MTLSTAANRYLWLVLVRFRKGQHWWFDHRCVGAAFDALIVGVLGLGITASVIVLYFPYLSSMFLIGGTLVFALVGFAVGWHSLGVDQDPRRRLPPPPS